MNSLAPTMRSGVWYTDDSNANADNDEDVDANYNDDNTGLITLVVLAICQIR